MASMMGPSNVGSASGFTSPNAPRRPPQIQTQQQGPQNGQPPTFGQMQSQGQPRPAPPPSWYNYTPGSTQQRPQPSYGTQPSQGGGFNPGSTAGGAGYAPGSGYRPPPTPQGPVTNAGGANPPPGPNMGGWSPQPWQPPGTPPTPQTPQAGGGGFQTAQPSGFNPNATAGGGGYATVPPGGYPSVSPGGAQYGATPGATTQQQNAANQLGSATQNLLLGQLQNPDPLASQAFQTQMQQAQTGINENMQQQADAINSNLASRGVYDSTLAGGYLKDLSTGAGRQMASIGANLLPQEAQLQLQGTNSALANALGYGQNQFNQQYQTAGLNLQQQAMQNQQLAQLLGLTQQ